MVIKRFNKTVSLNNKNLRKIITFYLLECPVEGKNNNDIKVFKDYGFKGQSSFAKLKKDFLNSSINLKENYYPSKKSELDHFFSKIKNFDSEKEFTIFLKSDEKTVIQSLFSAIRNSIAHNTFYSSKTKMEVYYYFENNKDYKKAAIYLLEKTLLNWIDIIVNNK